MLILISPAKSLDFETSAPTNLESETLFNEESTKLAKKMRTFSKKKLGELMSISSELAQLNVNRFNDWTPTPTKEQTKQALFCFTGEVYRGLNASEMDDSDLEYAQNHLRILSGLYGLLRPLDRMQPYRLEMGTKLKYYSNNNLYQFWGDKITKRINEDLQPDDYIINLASTEYYKSVNGKKLKANVITPIFKDLNKNGDYKIVMMYAKNARGVMANFILKNRIEEPEVLKSFNENGYIYDAHSSNESDWVFLRG